MYFIILDYKSIILTLIIMELLQNSGFDVIVCSCVNVSPIPVSVKAMLFGHVTLCLIYFGSWLSCCVHFNWEIRIVTFDTKFCLV